MSDELVEGVAGSALLSDLHAALDRLLAGDDYPERARLLFTTAVVEITSNIVEHAAEGRPIAVGIRLAATPRSLEAWLDDAGRALGRPLEIPPMPDDLAEHGRGLAIAAAAVDRLEYERRGDRNHWHLLKQL